MCSIRSCARHWVASAQKLETARDTQNTVEGCRLTFDRAIEETDGTLQTFDALLRIGKIDAGGATTCFSQVDLSALAAGAAEGYRAVAEDQGQTIVVAIEPGIWGRGDTGLITQMVVNLVENAIRHCAPALGSRFACFMTTGSPVLSRLIMAAGCQHRSCRTS